MTKEKIRVIVFVKDREEMDKYFKLFVFMLKDKMIQSRHSMNESYVMTEEMLIEVMPASYHARGKRAHYVVDLTQDIDFHKLVAEPIELKFTYLDKDNILKQIEEFED